MSEPLSRCRCGGEVVLLWATSKEKGKKDWRVACGVFYNGRCCPASTAWHPTAEAAREEWEGRVGK